MSLMHGGKLRPTFDYLFGRGIVDLFLGAVGGKHLVKHVGLPLQDNGKKKHCYYSHDIVVNNTSHAMIHYEIWQ